MIIRKFLLTNKFLKMDKLIGSLNGLFKWSGESSWVGIVKSIITFTVLILIGVSVYLAYISYISWLSLLIGLGTIILLGVLFIIINNIVKNKETQFDDWYNKMRKREIAEEISNRDRRIETTPLIQEQLRALSYVNGPDSTGHAAVYEFHNGHSNPAGLGFQFAEMTAEEFGMVQHTAIHDVHQKLPLGLLQIPHLLRNMEDNMWYGDKESLKATDPKLYMIVSNYICEWLVIKLIKTSTEIGMLCYFSQKEVEEKDVDMILESVNNAALIIGQHLDYTEYREYKDFKEFKPC